MSSIKDIAKASTMDVAERLCKDASYIPEEKLDWRPMEHGKSAIQILKECASTNFRIADVVKGLDARDMFEVSGLEEIKKHLMDSAAEVCAAIDSLCETPDMIQMPWGASMSAMEAIMLPAAHMQYHDGQINYIQLLLGDTAFHWAED